MDAGDYAAMKGQKASATSFRVNSQPTRKWPLLYSLERDFVISRFFLRELLEDIDDDFSARRLFGIEGGAVDEEQGIVIDRVDGLDDGRMGTVVPSGLFV
jgi:hypothetical protein